MKCPRCVQAIHRGAVSCPHCGFGIAGLDERYGAGEIRVRRLEDRAGLMKARERERVERAMDEFERRFPQLFFAVYTGRAEGRSDVRQFGFWLLNRAAFEDVGLERPNEWGILLVIDPEARSAGMTWGYGLDAFLTEEDTFPFLSRAHACWVEGRYADGIVRGLEQMSPLIRKRCLEVRRDPERFERKVVPLAAAGLPEALRWRHRKSGIREVLR